MKEQFIEKAFTKPSLQLIDWANGIIAEYTEQGYALTLRQLYYQMVARDLIPNTERSYKRTGKIISDARLAGKIDWDAIEDRTRSLARLSTWSSPGDLIKSAARQYRRDVWEEQPYHIEVWVEKEALASVIARACNPYRVSFFSCRGYVSQSEMYVAAKRLSEKVMSGKYVRVVHLGDHDPSGIDMSRDIKERLELLMHEQTVDALEFERIALNYDQIEIYSPPPNFAKLSDSRYGAYKKKFGGDSWELDALEPSVLVEMIQAEITAEIDFDTWEESLSVEQAERNTLVELSKKY